MAIYLVHHLERKYKKFLPRPGFEPGTVHSKWFWTNALDQTATVPSLHTLHTLQFTITCAAFQLVHRPTLWWYSNLNYLNFLFSQKWTKLSPLSGFEPGTSLVASRHLIHFQTKNYLSLKRCCQLNGKKQK